MINPAEELQQGVDRELAEVAALNRSQLQRRWLELFPTAAHPRLSRSLLVSIISYRIQEEAFGGLSSELKAQLRMLYKQHCQRTDRSQRARPVSEFRTHTADLRKKRPPTRVQLKPGTRLLRQWRGETYAVLVVENGYEFRGTTYKTLSEIARLITGTRWSGPLYFGLKAPVNPSRSTTTNAAPAS